MSAQHVLPNATNLSFVESLYAEYLRDPAAVDPQWRRYFAALGDGAGAGPGAGFGPSFRPASIFNPPTGLNGATAAQVGAGSAAGPRGPNGPVVPGCAGTSWRRSTRWGGRGPRRRGWSRRSMALPRLISIGPFSSRTIHGAGSPVVAGYSGAVAQHVLPLDRRTVHAHR